jgi:hypothetical protein
VLRSRLVLAGLAVLLILGLHYSNRPARPSPSQPGGDIVLFRAVVERMRAGEPYYSAMNAELRARSYPTGSVVNWRLPGTFVLVAKAPRVSHALMLALGAAGLLLSVYLFRNAPPMLTIASSIVMLGASLVPAIPTDGLYMPELWAGMFLLFSVLAYAFGHTRTAVSFAIAAACARELALPYALASLALAVWARRAVEIRWYAAGLAVFVAYYAAHAVFASRYIQAGDYAYPTWVTFNGWPFVVSTVGMGGWFLVLPLWAAAVGAVIILASVWSPADLHLRVMVALYMAAFCFVGHSFNDYWGLMTGPTWGLAALYGVIGLKNLFASAGRDRHHGAP